MKVASKLLGKLSKTNHLLPTMDYFIKLSDLRFIEIGSVFVFLHSIIKKR